MYHLLFLIFYNIKFEFINFCYLFFYVISKKSYEYYNVCFISGKEAIK